MRKALIVALACLTALSGCLGDGDDETPPATDTSLEPAGTNETVERIFTDYSCDVLAGAEGVSFSTDFGGVGGCTPVVLEATRELFAADVPDGCNLEYDADGDSLSDGAAVVGNTYDAGTSLVAFCGAGVMQVTVTLTMASP